MQSEQYFIRMICVLKVKKATILFLVEVPLNAKNVDGNI